jgi:hypothetical protein
MFKETEDIDPLTKPIAREGEQQYAVILRNRSGQDSGEIDYSVRIFIIESMDDYNQRETVSSAIMLLETIIGYVRPEAIKVNKWMFDRLSLKVDRAIKGTEVLDNQME